MSEEKSQQQTHVFLSHSAIQEYRKCPRRYMLRYIEGLTKPVTRESYSMVLGSAFHAGLQAALQAYHELFHLTSVPMNLETVVASGRAGVAVWVKANTSEQKMTEVFGQSVVDVDYYVMMKEISEHARELVAYYVPLLELGTRYRTVSESEYIPGGAETALLEYEFSVDLDVAASDATITVTGIVDALLYDKQTQELIAVDWKTRKAIIPDYLAALDSQLRVYALALHTVGIPVDNVIQWQFLSQAPQPPKLTDYGSVPSMSAQATTWEVWAAGIAALGYNPEDYRVRMEGKLRTPDMYMMKSEVMVSEAVLANAQAGLFDAAALMSFSIQGNIFPGILDSWGCKMCPFTRICGLVENGDDPTHVISEYYEINPDQVRIFMEEE